MGETTCDGKKKAYEAFAEYVPMYGDGSAAKRKTRDREFEG
ncbi:MAG: 2-hydroxyacyl-CoA dehydratase family protein [Desulfobacterales bacterium]